MELPLQVILLAIGNTHLMLNIAELKNLFLQLLFREYQLFCFRIQLILHFIKVGVKLSNRHF